MKEPTSVEFVTVVVPLKGRAPRLLWVSNDAGERPRYADSTNVGAYEYVVPSSVNDDVDQSGQTLQAFYGTSATVCARGQRMLVQVFAINGSMLTCELVDIGECRTIAWHGMQPVLVRSL